MNEMINEKFQKLLEIIEKKLGKKTKINSQEDMKKVACYLKLIEKLEPNQTKILEILKGFIYSDNKIKIINKNYQIFFSKFLDISIKIFSDKPRKDKKDKKDKIKIIINSEELNSLKEDKKLILKYISLSLLSKKHSLKIFFGFLNQNISLLSSSFLVLNEMKDLTDIELLEEAYKMTYLMNKDKKDKEKISLNESQIKIIYNEDNSKEEIKKEDDYKTLEKAKKKEEPKIKKEINRREDEKKKILTKIKNRRLQRSQKLKKR